MYTSNIELKYKLYCTIQVYKSKKSVKMKYTSLRVREDRKIELEKAAIEISYSLGKQIKWTDVANYMFKECLKETIKEMKSKT